MKVETIFLYATVCLLVLWQRPRVAVSLLLCFTGLLRISPDEVFELGVDAAKQNDMMDARWKYFHHPASLQVCADCAPCARCFAKWLCD